MLSLLAPLVAERERSVVVGGAEISTLPFGGYDGVHTLLGAIPVLLHPSPRRVAVIGLGSGDTLYAAAGRPGLEEVIGIEIIGSQLDLLRHFQARGGDRGAARPVRSSQASASRSQTAAPSCAAIRSGLPA